MDSIKEETGSVATSFEGGKVFHADFHSWSRDLADKLFSKYPEHRRFYDILRGKLWSKISAYVAIAGGAQKAMSKKKSSGKTAAVSFVGSIPLVGAAAAAITDQAYSAAVEARDYSKKIRDSFLDVNIQRVSTLTALKLSAILFEVLNGKGQGGAEKFAEQIYGKIKNGLAETSRSSGPMSDRLVEHALKEPSMWKGMNFLATYGGDIWIRSGYEAQTEAFGGTVLWAKSEVFASRLGFEKTNGRRSVPESQSNFMDVADALSVFEDSLSIDDPSVFFKLHKKLEQANMVSLSKESFVSSGKSGFLIDLDDSGSSNNG